MNQEEFRAFLPIKPRRSHWARCRDEMGDEMPLTTKKKPVTTKASTMAASRSEATRPVSPGAIELLKTDHREVEEFFAQFEKASSRQRKAAIVANICRA